MPRPLTARQQALLDEMSRSSHPSQEAQEQLAYELQSSELARRAFAAELVQLRQFRDLARANRRALPPRLQGAVDRLLRARDFEHLVALGEAALLPAGREPGMD